MEIVGNFPKGKPMAKDSILHRCIQLIEKKILLILLPWINIFIPYHPSFLVLFSSPHTHQLLVLIAPVAMIPTHSARKPKQVS